MEVGSISYTVDANISGLLKFDKQVAASTSAAVEGFNDVDDAARKASQGINQLTPAAQGVNRAVSGMGGNLGQAGIQFQQFVGQIQGGTSAFTALAQQGADLGIVLGAPLIGVIVSLAAVIGGVLYNSIEKTKGSMKELPEELQKYLEEVKKRYSEVDEASQAAFTQVELGKLNTQFDKQQQVVTNLQKSIALYTAEASKGNQSAAAAVATYTLQLKSAQTELLNIGKLQERLGAELAGAGVKGDVGAGTRDAADAATQLGAQLSIAIAKFEQGDLAARRMAAAQALGLTAAESLPPEIDAALVKLTQLEAAEKRVAEIKREQLELQREARAELDRELQAELAMMDTKARAKEGIGRIATDAGVDAGGESARIEAAAAKRVTQIQAFAATDKSLAEEAAAAILAVEEAKQAELTRIANEGAEKRRQFAQQSTASTLSAFGELFGNLADVAKEGGEDTFKQYKLLASAQAAISAALAITNVLANPLIPYPLNIGLAASVGALAGVQIAKIQGQQYSGKLYGGPVQAGGMYPVTEDGRPEILQQGNRQYLLPGDRGGRVVSNRDMQQGAAGGQTVVMINNYTGENVTQSRQQGPSGQEIISVVVGDINRRGQIHAAITRNTTAGNRSS